MFTKGQAVYLIVSWNDNGYFTVRPAVVHSCGKKVMVLHDPDGTFIGRNFNPSQEQHGRNRVVHRGENVGAGFNEYEAKEYAFALATDYAAEHRAEFNRRRAMETNDAGRRYWDDRLSALHVRVSTHAEALAAIRARHEAKQRKGD